jgi:uncharacterized repeat protein (TIGR02543 family)
MLTATAEIGYTFTGWSGEASGAKNPMTMKMDGSKTLVANFRPAGATPEQYTLTTSVFPAGGGTVSISPSKAKYDAGERVAVTATAASGYTFINWSVGSNTTIVLDTAKITMDGNKALTAIFRQTGVTPPPTPAQYTLTVPPTSGGTVSLDPSKAKYDAGERVTAAATAASGYTFAGWQGAAMGTTNPVTITMDGNKTLSANFQTGVTPPPTPAQYTLTATVSPPGGGTVSRNPSKTKYDAGESVEVTALAANGYKFTGWSGASGGINAALIVIMDGDVELTANFTQNSSGGGVELVGDWLLYSETYDGGTRYASEEAPNEKIVLSFRSSGEAVAVDFRKAGNIWIEGGEETVRWRTDGSAIFISENGEREELWVQYRIQGNNLITSDCYNYIDDGERCKEVTYVRTPLTGVRNSLGTVRTTDPKLYGDWVLQGQGNDVYERIDFYRSAYYYGASRYIEVSSGYWYTIGNNLYLIGEECEWDDGYHERCEITAPVSLSYAVSGSGDSRVLLINNRDAWVIEPDNYYGPPAKSRQSKGVFKNRLFGKYGGRNK